MLDKLHYFRMARVLGTGGAARAIITALAGEKLVIVLAGRNIDKARALLDELDPTGEHIAADLAHFADATDFAFDDREDCLDLVVNASSLGMTGQPPLIFDMSHAPPGHDARKIRPNSRPANARCRKTGQGRFCDRYGNHAGENKQCR